MPLANRAGLSTTVVVTVIAGIFLLAVGLFVYDEYRKKETPIYRPASNQTDENASLNSNSQNVNQSAVSGWKKYQNSTYGFEINYQDDWVVKDYAEETKTDGGFSKLINFYSYDDFQKVNSGKSQSIKGSAAIEVHGADWSVYQTVSQSQSADLTAVQVAGLAGYRSASEQRIYLLNSDKVYVLIHRGTDNADVYQSMVDSFKLL